MNIPQINQGRDPDDLFAQQQDSDDLFANRPELQKKKPKEKRTGYGAIAEDLAKGAFMAVPEAIRLGIKLPGQIYDAGKQAIQNPERAKQNVRAGTASAVGGALNIPGNIVDYLKERGVAPDYLTAWRPGEHGLLPKDFNYREAEGLLDQQPGDELIYGLSQFAPNMLLGGAAPAAWAVGQNENPITAQLMPKAGGMVANAAKKSFIHAKNAPEIAASKFGSYPKEEIIANERAAKGTETPLHAVTGSPTLQAVHENVSSHVMGGGGAKVNERINTQIEGRVNSILDNLLNNNQKNGLTTGHESVSSGHTVKRVLDAAFDTARKEKNNLYNESAELAKKLDVKFHLNEFGQELLQSADIIRSSPLYKTNSKFKKAFNDVAGLIEYKHNPTLVQLKSLMNDLDLNGQKLQKLPNGADMYIGQLYSELANKGRQEIKNIIKDSGSKELIEAYGEAEENYVNNYRPFLESDVHNFFAKDQNAHTVVREIIKPSKRVDNAAAIEKIQAIMPEGNQNLLGYTYLKNCIDKEGHLNINEFNNLINSLGNKQFEALFPNVENRQALTDFTRLYKMNAAARGHMFNPKTGYSVQKALSQFSPMTVAFGLLVSGNPIGALIAIGVPPLAARYFNSRMTNPEFREATLKRMLTSQKGKIAPVNPKLTDIAAQLGLSTLAGEEKKKD